MSKGNATKLLSSRSLLVPEIGHLMSDFRRATIREPSCPKKPSKLLIIKYVLHIHEANPAESFAAGPPFRSDRRLHVPVRFCW